LRKFNDIAIVSGRDCSRILSVPPAQPLTSPPGS
jgi:hypothetical protein